MLNRDDNAFLYEQLSSRLEQSIMNKSLAPGDRLPSVRALCARERVSPGSVLQAYGQLEARGLIEARPKSGYYVAQRLTLKGRVPVHQHIAPAVPTVVGVSDTVASVFKTGSTEGLIPLGAAVPDASFFPSEDLAKLLASTAREKPLRLTSYELDSGDALLRKELARRLGTCGCDVAPDELVVTCGAVEALNLAIRSVARPGEMVAVDTPIYFTILEILESLGIKAVPIPSDCCTGTDLKALAEALEKHPIKAALVIPNFNNPTGSLMPDENKKALVSLMEDHGLPIIEDDVYGEIPFRGERPLPLRAFDTGGNVIHCSSFSKVLAPGFRTGWVAGGRFTERIRRLKYITSVSSSAVPQNALAQFLQKGRFDRHLRKLRALFASQTARMSDAVLETFPEGTCISQPQGAFFLWVQLPPNLDCMELFDKAMRAGIGIAPGIIFCPRGGFRNYIRLNTGLAWSPAIERALGVLGHLASELAHR